MARTARPTPAARVAAVRAKRLEDGLCSSCMKRPAGSPAKDLCASCYVDHVAYLKQRYEERRAAGLCVQCGKKADGYLCEKHAEARRKRRQRSGR